MVAETSRSLKYVEANDRVYVIFWVSQDSHSGKVDGLKWNLCVYFGREENVESNQKPTVNVMYWKRTFQNDNIKKHLQYTV